MPRRATGRVAVLKGRGPLSGRRFRTMALATHVRSGWRHVIPGPPRTGFSRGQTAGFERQGCMARRRVAGPGSGIRRIAPRSEHGELVRQEAVCFVEGVDRVQQADQCGTLETLRRLVAGNEPVRRSSVLRLRSGVKRAAAWARSLSTHIEAVDRSSFTDASNLVDHCASRTPVSRISPSACGTNPLTLASAAHSQVGLYSTMYGTSSCTSRATSR